jgi:hypothetical protein
MRRFNHSIVVALATLLLSFSICSAQQASTTSVPDLIRSSGTLKDAQGAALSSSTAVGVTFCIYKQQDGGAAVWMETQNVTPDSNGQYSVIVGSTTAAGLPDDLFSQQEQRWLGVQVQGQAEQARVLLVSVPYAFKAHEAETLGGLPPSAFVKAATSDDASGTSVNALSAVGKADSPAATGKSKTTRTPCSYLVNYIPVFTDTSGSLCNSIMFQDILGLEINGNINLPANGIVYFGGTHVFATPPNQNLSVGQNAGPGGGGSASYNVLLGPSTGFNIEDGSANTFVGYFAGYANFDGGHNTFVGYQAGISNTSNDFPSLISGQYNTFVGSQVGYSNTLGSNNTFYGYQSGYRNTVGNQSSFFGYQAGYNSNGAATSSGVSSNTFLGYQAGFTNTNGLSNTFAGHTAGYNSTGSFNTFYGASAGFANTTASQNTFVGYLAGTANKTGDSNTFLGSWPAQRTLLALATPSSEPMRASARTHLRTPFSVTRPVPKPPPDSATPPWATMQAAATSPEYLMPALGTTPV